MNALKRHARLLYMLALCQVLGGPLVLGGLLLLTQITSGGHVEQRVVDTLLRLEARECAALFAQGELPAKKGAPATPPAPAGKGKADKGWTHGHLAALRVYAPAPVRMGVAARHDRPPTGPAHAPPLPPPRLA